MLQAGKNATNFVLQHKNVNIGHGIIEAIKVPQRHVGWKIIYVKRNPPHMQFLETSQNITNYHKYVVKF